ncbi:MULTISPECIES: Hsp70 family protein [unclassified Sphingomonas]|uniref:Hsp70 family protein n=1 Tax=unclassified Sphingomonas TaxID=196159 RepID=UPI0006F1DC70|nr:MULTISPECIES: Hsp70 family protein [unclassified Sphingomonas]KQM59940.1 molecular chaperone Hsp70 [Sphingomonas sp. Leaf16]KQN11338.1 molecular chaperone Hsp70 [Sphingomonas sp. Leaf29]KQN18660.1 molecular chaperone Hsp70 [Sphingomonas sp. Leaf32]
MSLGLDFGTTNSVLARADADGATLVPLDGPDGPDAVFRSALCFWQDDVPGGIAVEAGPWAIDEYLHYPEGCRFLQSFKSVAASPSFDTAPIFTKRYRFEDLGRAFLDRLAARAHGVLNGAKRIVVGRPITYAGHRPDEALARQRYDAMFAALGAEIVYVYEPLGAAFSHAATLSDTATILVADFGGGTSDFSVVRLEAPGSERRARPLGHAGIGIAGDQFDRRILDKLVLPLLGKGGTYRSFDKVLEIPAGHFTDFTDWSRLALMRNRKTMAELDKLRRAATDPAAIERMIAVIEGEQGYPLYDAVGQVKRALSQGDEATFAFDGGGIAIEAQVTRNQFEAWIADDLARIMATVDRALDSAGLDTAGIDRVFLTGGTSLTPAIRRAFADRFGQDRLASGNELTSVAHGLALIGQQDDVAAWTA